MHDQFLAMPNDQFAASQPLFTSRLVISSGGAKAVSASSIASDRTVFANAMLEDLATDLRPQLASIKTPMTLLYPYEPAEGSATDVAALYTNAYAAKPNLQVIRIDELPPLHHVRPASRLRQSRPVPPKTLIFFRPAPSQSASQIIGLRQSLYI